MAQLDKTFPTLDCAACILTPKMVDAAQNENIKIYSYSEVDSGQGICRQLRRHDQEEGTLRQRRRCAPAAAPAPKSVRRRRSRTSSTSDMDNRRAIYIPFAQAVPKVATIDPNYCTKLKTGKCGVCSKVCAAGAIDYDAEGRVHRGKVRRDRRRDRLQSDQAGSVRRVRLRRSRRTSSPPSSSSVS